VSEQTSPEDEELAGSYPSFRDKGTPVDGYRLTILVSGGAHRVGEPVRIVHVCESVTPGKDLFVMGPKPVYDEYVDGRLATLPTPAGEHPLAPSAYDGRVVEGPGVDFNYEVTQYRFDAAGSHAVQWRPPPFASNVLHVEVVPG
jgi:hypothetical protein